MRTMTDYQNSTHKARWIFQPAVLCQKREAANARAVNRIRQYGASNFEVEPATLYIHVPEENVLPDGEENPQQPLTVHEEALICRSYELRIQQTCASLKFPHAVQATAITFFKRFYLEWSVMDFPPNRIMLTCIFLAVKAENHQFCLTDIAFHLEEDEEVVDKYEILVLETTELDIAVYTPYLSYHGFCFDMEDFFVEVDATHINLKGFRDAKQYIDKLILTNVPLLHNPGQIALAALQQANEQLKLVDFDRYLEWVCSKRSDLSVEILKEACRQIISYLESDELEAEADTTRDIEERLKGLKTLSLHKPKQSPRLSTAKPLTWSLNFGLDYNINDSNMGFPSLFNSDDIDSKMEDEGWKIFCSNEAPKKEKCFSSNETPDTMEMPTQKESSQWKGTSGRLLDDDDGCTENTSGTPGFGVKRVKTVQ